MIRLEMIRPLGELIRHQAAHRSDAPAYADASRGVSYRQLAERTGTLAGHLRSFGVAPGKTVALYLPNSVDWIETCFAIARAGGIVVPISYDASPDEVAYRLEDAGCTLIVTTDEKAELVGSLANTAPIIRADRGGALPQGGLRLAELLVQSAPVKPLDPAALDEARFIVYTSGTTGRAKGVILTERSMLWVVAACWAPVAGLTEHDRVLSPLPLFHSYALNLCVLGILATGASEYILERFSTREVFHLLDSGDFTVMPGVPTMFHYLLNAARGEGLASPAGLRLCLSAGAIMPGPLNAEFEAFFGAPLLDGYGITETSTMVTLNWPTGGRIMGSCGLPVPGLATRIVDAITREDVTRGDEGELLVRGPNVMLGYHAKAEETTKTLAGGWYHTGDLARSDANGFLTITGRLKELIIRGGQNIAPAEVELVVAAFPPVLDCAVVALGHEFLGEVPVAFVVARDKQHIDHVALLAHCQAHLSAYKVPSSVHIVPEIPRTGSGKVMRFRLRALLEPPS